MSGEVPTASGGAGDTGVSRQARAVADRGLLVPERPVETLATIYDPVAHAFAPCASDLLGDLEGEVAALPRGPDTLPDADRSVHYDERTLDRIQELGGLAAVVHDSTPCLFRLLHLIDGALTLDTHLAFPQRFMDLADQALRVAEKIAERTRGPYVTLATMRENPALDPAVLTLPPLDRRGDWQRFADLRTGRSLYAPDRDQGDPAYTVADRQRFQEQMEELALELGSRAAEARIAAQAAGSRTPVFDRSMGTLKALRFADVERGTRARFKEEYRDRSVASTVKVVFYSSVYTVLLDPRGEPMQIPGIAPYGLLVARPGEELVQRLKPPGLYISLGALAGYQLKVLGPRRTQALIFSSIFGLQRNVFGMSREELGTEASKHRLHHALHDHLEANYPRRTLAFIITEDAFGSGPLSFARLRRTVYRMIPLIAEFTVEDIMGRLASLPGELGERVAELAETVIREVVEDEIRDWAVEWLIKKIGKRVIPVVNLVSAINDVISDGDAERYRNVAACLIMATRSGRPDDLTITSKILAKVATDQIADAVVDQLVSTASKQVSSAVRSTSPSPSPSATDLSRVPSEPVPSESPVRASPEQVPADTGATPVADIPFESPPAPPTEVVPTEPPVLPRPQPMRRHTSTPAERAAAEGARARGTADPGVDDPASRESARDTDARTVPERPRTEARPLAPGVRRRSGAEAEEARRRRRAQQDEPDRGRGDRAAEDFLTDTDRELHERSVEEERKARDRREVHAEITEGTGAGQKPHEVGARDLEEVEGIHERPAGRGPGGAEPRGKVTGMIGELEERRDAGIDPEYDIPDYRSRSTHEKERHREEILRGYAAGDEEALTKFVAQLDIPPGGIAEVEIPAPAPRSTTQQGVPDDGSRTRRYDRVYVDPDTKEAVLVEAKNYESSVLTYDRVRRQIENDDVILERFTGVRIEVFLNGRVSTHCLEEYRRRAQKHEGRYVLRYGPDFQQVTETSGKPRGPVRPAKKAASGDR